MSMSRYRNENDTLFKVGIYLRLSQEDKVKKDTESNSIENQRRIIKKYIDSNEDLVFISEYADDGYSGTSFNRPGFQEMLKDLKNSKIDTIIVKDLSRFGRNYVEVGRFLEDTFPTMRVRFISIIDKIDSFKNPESSSSMLVNFKNLINDEYARDISRKIKSVYRIKQKKGEYIAAHVPFGYRKDPDNKYHLLIDMEGAKIVKLIFELALNNKTAIQIADYLNERKFPTPSQYKKQKGQFYKTNIVTDENIDEIKWNPRIISNILRNEIYTGNLIQNKKNKISYKLKKRIDVEKEDWIKVENTHEALVSKEDFKWIQEKYYSKIIQIRRKNHDYALFSGFLICNDCHRGLYYLESRRPRKDGSRLKYYICGTNKVNSKGCTPHRIKEDDLIEIVRKSINKQIKLVTKLNDDLELISKNKKLSIKGDILLERKNTLSESINQKMKLKQSLYTDWKEEIITFEDYKNYSSSYNNEILEIRETIKIIDKELEELDNIPNYQVDLIKLFNNKELFKKIDRDILFKFIECIYIFEDKKVEIVFKYQDIYQNLLEYVKKNKSYLKPA